MGIVIDVIIVAIIAISAVFAYKKGFIGTVFSLVGTVVAIVLSVMLCNPVAEVVDKNYVNPAVKSYIETTVEKSLDDVIPEGGKFDFGIENMPASIKSLLDFAGVNNIEGNLANSTQELVERIANPISKTISRVVTLVVLFAVLNIALWVVCKLITAVFNALPLGKKLNKIGGLAFGIIRGLLIVFVVSLLFGALISQKTVNSTYILKTVSNINPISQILNIK